MREHFLSSDALSAWAIAIGFESEKWSGFPDWHRLRGARWVGSRGPARARSLETARYAASSRSVLRPPGVASLPVRDGGFVPSFEPGGEEPPTRRNSLRCDGSAAREGPVIEAVQAPAVVGAASLQTDHARRPLMGAGRAAIPHPEICRLSFVPFAASSLKQLPSIAPQLGGARVLFRRIRPTGCGPHGWECQWVSRRL